MSDGRSVAAGRRKQCRGGRAPSNRIQYPPPGDHVARRVLAAPFLYVRTSWSAKKYLAYSVIVTFVLKSRALRKAASIAFMCVSWQWGSRDEKSTLKIAESYHVFDASAIAHSVHGRHVCVVSESPPAPETARSTPASRDVWRKAGATRYEFAAKDDGDDDEDDGVANELQNARLGLLPPASRRPPTFDEYVQLSLVLAANTELARLMTWPAKYVLPPPRDPRIARGTGAADDGVVDDAPPPISAVPPPAGAVGTEPPHHIGPAGEMAGAAGLRGTASGEGRAQEGPSVRDELLRKLKLALDPKTAQMLYSNPHFMQAERSTREAVFALVRPTRQQVLMMNQYASNLVTSADQSPLREMAARRLQREFRAFLKRRRLKRIQKAKAAAKKVAKANNILLHLKHGFG